MEISQLRYVSVIAQELNFQRAAERLGVTQPNLSQQLKKFEDEVGLQLFERNNRSVKLRREAAHFIIRIREILSGLNQLKNEIQQTKSELSGTIVLSSIPTIGPYLLPKVLPFLKKAAPKLNLTIREETTSNVLESVSLGLSDIGLLALPINHRGLVTRKTGSEEFFLAVNKRHRLAKKSIISFSEIKSEEILLLQEGHCFRDQALEFCHRHRFDPNVTFEGSSLTSVLNLAASGQGVTFAPKMSLESHDNRNLAFIPFEKSKPIRDIGVCWRFTMSLSKVQKLLIDVIEKFT